MRKIALILCFMMIFGLLAACGGPATTSTPAGTSGTTAGTTTGATSGGTAATTAASTEPVKIYIFSNQPEYSDAFNAYIEAYKSVAPHVTIDMEVNQADYPTLVKAKLSSGEVPEVFCSTAGAEIKLYMEYSADLTNEPLAAAMLDSVRANMSYEGKVYGLPVKANCFGIVYNKTLFEEAGITTLPKTITEMKAACEKLVAKGYTPFSNGYKEWWVQKHIFQHYLDASTDNASDLVAKFIKGEAKFADYPLLSTNFFDFLDLTVKYGMAKPLEADLNAEIAAFGTGKAAMMTGQGPWTEEAVMAIDPNLKLGIMGYPVDDNPAHSRIITGADQALRIYKDSPVVNEVIKLYNWLYTSEYGKKWFSDVAKVIPPIKDAPIPNLQIPQAMKAILDSGEAVGDMAIIYSTDSFHQKFGEIAQSYLAGTIKRDQAISEMEKAWVDLGGGN
ncbi:MAG: extracellular solute-binding protein [Clostridiaceae bacterium]|nr:extracellular solute-binding protein [Clostridiaceae bacterium]